VLLPLSKVDRHVLDWPFREPKIIFIMETPETRPEQKQPTDIAVITIPCPALTHLRLPVEMLAPVVDSLTAQVSAACAETQSQFDGVVSIELFPASSAEPWFTAVIKGSFSVVRAARQCLLKRCPFQVSYFSIDALFHPFMQGYCLY
jgi:hypothetical protein